MAARHRKCPTAEKVVYTSFTARNGGIATGAVRGPAVPVPRRALAYHHQHPQERNKETMTSRLHYAGQGTAAGPSDSGAYRDIHLCPKEFGDSCAEDGPHDGTRLIGWVEQGRDMVSIIGGVTHAWTEYQFVSADRGPRFPERQAYNHQGPYESQGALQDAQGYARLVAEARKAGLRDEDQDAPARS